MPLGDPSDKYESVSVNLVTVRPKAILVEVDDEQHWFSRSCLFGPDDLGLDRLATPCELELKVRAWHLRQKGL